MRSTPRAPHASARRAVLAAGWLAVGWLAAAVSPADWLVTREGERIETLGTWEVRGRQVVFTRVSGTLSSLRLSQVDLEASATATADAEAAAAAPVTPDAEPPARPPVMVLTTADVGEGAAGAEGVELLIERLRQAHQYKDVELAMGLVNWQDAPQGVRAYIETQFEWMMERRIRSVRFIAADPDAGVLQEIQDDVLYEPNVEVAGRIEIAFIPDPDQSQLSLTFTVGTRLGQYFIAAPREADAP